MSNPTLNEWQEASAVIDSVIDKERARCAQNMGKAGGVVQVKRHCEADRDWRSKRPSEYVCDGHEFRWQQPTDQSSPIGIITYSEVDGPELPAGWVYWALGKVGSADSYEDAKNKIESIVAGRTHCHAESGSYLARVVEQIGSVRAKAAEVAGEK